MPEATMYQHLDAGHDTNGNPKRLYIVLDYSGSISAVVEEGYAGIGSLTNAGYQPREMVQLPELTITPAQYRELKRRD